MTKDPSAVSLGRKGGLAKWSKIPKKQRSTIMKKVRKGGKPTKVEWYKGGQIFERAVNRKN